MPQTQLDPVVRHIRRLAGAPDAPEPTDADLLRRFREEKEEDAFAALVRRHGGLVMGVCRRVLGHAQDAEDAFQATFLTLARRADSIGAGQAVGSWLYRVAHRIAQRAGRTMARRSARERLSAVATAPAPSSEASLRELQTVVDDELQRLAEKYRAPFVLCCLEGKSRSEAARELGWKEGTVASRLAEARRLLQTRLAKRGVALSTALAAFGLRDGAAVAVAPALARATARAAAAVAGGKAVAEVVGRAVAALVENGSGFLAPSPAKALTALLLLAGTLAAASAGAPARPTEEKKTPVAKVAQAEEPPAARSPAPPGETKGVTIRGVVIGAGGKAVAGAKVYYQPFDGVAMLPHRLGAVSDADGSFRFTAEGRKAFLVVAAEGYGAAWEVIPEAGLNLLTFLLDSALPVRLVRDDTLVRGRVLDLQGRPVAGATVKVRALKTPHAGKLDAWLRAATTRKDGVRAENENFMTFAPPALADAFPPLTTDKDGAFRLAGVGRERVVTLVVEGPTIETNEINVIAREGVPTVRLNQHPEAPELGQLTYYAATFDHAAAPGRVAAGVVRDKATGKPIAGVVVRAAEPVGGYPNYEIATKTDKDGRYRLTGLSRTPRAGREGVVALSPEGQTYLAARKPLGGAPGAEPIALDFDLRKGVRVEGRVTDGATGKPVQARVSYYVFADAGQKEEAKALFLSQHDPNNLRADKDGKFRLVAFPGRGLLGARADGPTGEQYAIGVGADGIEGKADFPGTPTFATYPFYASSWDFDSVMEVKPAAGAESVTCDLVLNPGRTRAVRVEGPDGKPLAGAYAHGRNARLGWDSVGAEFTAYGLKPGESRTLLFQHPQKKLAGIATVKADESAPATVRLRPSAAVTGRLIDEDGRPLRDVAVSVQFQLAGQVNWVFNHMPQEERTDADGKFRVVGLVPDFAYDATIKEAGRLYPSRVFRALKLKEGETKDLGDVRPEKVDG